MTQPTEPTQDQNPQQTTQQPEALDALALQLTSIQHTLGGMMGQVQSALVLVQLELLARGRGPVPGPPGSFTHPATRAAMGLPPLPVGHPGATAAPGPPRTFGAARRAAAAAAAAAAAPAAPAEPADAPAAPAAPAPAAPAPSPSTPGGEHDGTSSR